jgi:signal transduction histidine kinase/CHASE3 domain sensor protein/CheY-like chemotaxis protein
MAEPVNRARSTANQANLLTFAALGVLVVFLVVVLHDVFASAHKARRLSERSYDMLVAVKDLDLALRDAETGQRGYLLTGDASYLAPYTSAASAVPPLEQRLAALTEGDPQAQATMRELGPPIALKLRELDRTIELRHDSGLPAAMRLVNTHFGRGLMTHIESTLMALQTREEAVLRGRLASLGRHSVLIRVASYSALTVLIGVLAAAAVLLNLSLRRASALETEQRNLFHRLRTSIDSISQGIAVFDEDRRLSDWNHCFEQLLHLPRLLVRAGAPYEDFVEMLGSDAAPFLETPAQIDAGGEDPERVVTYEVTTANQRFLEIRRSSMPSGGFVLTVSDMSKRREAEAVLRESQKMHAIGQLTGGLAHDFNNLLTVIMGNLEFARAKLDAPPEMLAARLDRAMWAAQRGATLTAQLLAFARRQPLAPSAIDLAASMPELVPLMRRTLGEQVEVRLVETAGLWPAMADRAQLESAVLNLALNARDAMPEGGRLTIELANKVLDAEYCRRHAEVDPGDYAMVAVSDTGEGMTPQVLARVFEPFFTTKPDGRGTGLGLPMVFGFVKQSGGHVNIYSEPGEGTTVRLYLPRARTAPAAKRLDAPTEVPRGVATVLVVEDEPSVREIAVSLLRDLGYQVIEAPDAIAGLALFEAEPDRFDLLLTDVVLPGPMRGRELAERAQALRPCLPVLFMSGYTENAILHHGRLDDGVNLISKPFKRDQLAQKVAEVLARSADT